jgi:hypothetical protein
MLLSSLTIHASELIMSLVMSNNEQESDELGQEDSCDDIIETQGPSQYEQKESHKNASKLQQLVQQVDIFHDTILHNPQLWNCPELWNTCEFVEQIAHDPVHFLPTLPVAAVHGEDENENVPLLTKGFTKSVYAGKVCDHHAVGNQFPIVILSLHLNPSTRLLSWGTILIKRNDLLFTWQMVMMRFLQ